MAWQEGGMKIRLDLQQRQTLVMTPQLQMAIRLLQLSRMELNQEINLQMLENPLLEESVSDLPEESSDLSTPSEEQETSLDQPDPGREEQGDSDTTESADSMDLKWDNYYEEEERERMESSRTFESNDEERPSYEQTLANTVSLGDHLLWQLRLAPLSTRDIEIGEEIIGNLDDHGYLEASIEEIAAAVPIHRDHATSAEEVAAVLRIIQVFDPAGVGARTLVECLLIQIQALGLAGSLVETIIKNHLEEIEKKRYAQIAKACNVSTEEVLQAAKIIEHLEPKPGRAFSSSDNFNIIPDAFVVKLTPEPNPAGTVNDFGAREEDPESPVSLGVAEPPLRIASFSEGVLQVDNTSTGEEGPQTQYAVFLNGDGIPRIKISGYYQSLLRAKTPGSEETRAYLEEKYRSAVWLVRSIEQRNRTILKVAESILKFQRSFMEKGIHHLRPLVLKQVAEDIAMHESTVSRVTTHKYIHTPQGIYEFKFFFNGSLRSAEGEAGGEGVSSVAVHERMEKMVKEENPEKPLTDQEIVERFKKEGVEIARRTVNKYRSDLNIASAARRKRAG
jgi:RNA polymerase sigma-54 factor